MIRGRFGFADVVVYVREVVQLNRYLQTQVTTAQKSRAPRAYLDNIQAHLQNVLRDGTIVSCTNVALEGRIQIATFVVEVTEFIVSSLSVHKIGDMIEKMETCANALLEQGSARRVQLALEPLLRLSCLLITSVQPCLIKGILGTKLVDLLRSLLVELTIITSELKESGGSNIHSVLCFLKLINSAL